MVTYCILIAGCVYLAFIPFDKKRVRARWAKSVFAICAVAGITIGMFGLASVMGWFMAGRLLQSYLDMVGGLFLGFIFSLIFSGQLSGIKRETKQLPNT